MLFPAFCFGCSREGSWLCKNCFSKIKIKNFQLCPICEKEITSYGFVCQKCKIQKKYHLDALLSAVSYEDPIIKELIYSLKYRFIGDVSFPLACIMVKSLQLHNAPLPFAIVPVPLHSRRLRWRGFNQAQKLAVHLSNILVPSLFIPVLDILERKKYNKPQMEIKNYQKRFENVANLFCLKPEAYSNQFKGKAIYLVDDIATTGATLEQCAKVLKIGGAKKVIAVVVARQSLKK